MNWAAAANIHVLSVVEGVWRKDQFSNSPVIMKIYMGNSRVELDGWMDRGFRILMTGDWARRHNNNNNK